MHTNQAHQFYTASSPTTQETQTLLFSLVLSPLDYCNSLPSCCPQYLLDKLQKLQNAAAQLVCKSKKSDHIQPILQSLHWPPVTHHIQYKISTVCFNSLSCKFSQYLSDLIQLYTPTRKLRSASDTPTVGSCRCRNKVPSGENTELERSPFKAWSRSVSSHTCYTYC